MSDERLEAEHGVRMGALGPDLARTVTHREVDIAGARCAVSAVTAVLRAARGADAPRSQLA